MKLNKREASTIYMALHYAIQWEESFLDAHREEFRPHEFQKGSSRVVRKTLANIERFRRLRREVVKMTEATP